MKYIYRIYQLFIAIPLLILVTMTLMTIVIIGCTYGDIYFWGYYPAMIWARLFVYLMLLPVKVEGRENIQDDKQYVFVSNHQGAYDIFLIYGFLGHNFRWMMKQQLRKVPFVGKACEKGHHVFVDKGGMSKIKKSYDDAREVLRDGMSLVVFPEGSRTFTGHMGKFRRGAFMLADEFQLPVVPMTINGSFQVKPRMKDIYWVFWHPLKLTIHKPIMPPGQGSDNVKQVMEQSYAAVMSSLEEQFQGYLENPDQ